MQNVNFEDAVRQIVVPLLYGEPHQLHPIGTAFLICAAGTSCIAVTAKHNLEAVHSIQNPRPRHHPSTPSFFLPKQEKKIELSSDRNIYLVINTGSGKALLQVECASSSECTDIAYLIAKIKPEYDFSLSFRSSIDPSPLRNGEAIIIMGYHKLQDQQTIYDDESASTIVRLNQGYFREVGVVLDRSNEASRLTPWPGARTSVPVFSGMSGAPVFSKDLWTRELVVRGIATSDISDNANAMVAGAGCSIVSEIWPSLICLLDVTNAESGRSGARTILELMDEGLIAHCGEVMERFVYFSKIGTKERVVAWREINDDEKFRLSTVSWSQ